MSKACPRERTAFEILFRDLLQNLSETFPECMATKALMVQLDKPGFTIDLIKQDWAQQITPYTLKGFKYAGHYFMRIRKEVPLKHTFNVLQLLEKFETLKTDPESQIELCSLLSDLEMFACVNELDEKSGSQTNAVMESRVKSSSRFSDPKLHAACITALGDEKMANELRTICSNEPLLNEVYQNKTNEQIVHEMKTMKPFLPLFIRLIKSKALPMQHIIKFMKRKTPQPGPSKK